MNKSDLTLSIVIPTYNEERRLRSTLVAARRYIKLRGLSAEIVVADDGSADGTVTLAASALAETPHQLLTNQDHVGKGDAVRRGVLAARGRFILFTDADLCTPFETLDRMWPWLDREYDIVIGTRRHHDAHIIVPQPWIRAALGCVYIWLTNLLLTTSFSDTNCGFKIFRSRVAHYLFALQRQPDWCFDAEILFLARRLGYLIKEIPVVWRHHSGTKVKPWKDVCTSLLGLLCIRLRAWRQVYGTLLPMREIEQCAVSPHHCSPVSDSLA